MWNSLVTYLLLRLPRTHTSANSSLYAIEELVVHKCDSIPRCKLQTDFLYTCFSSWFSKKIAAINFCLYSARSYFVLRYLFQIKGVRVSCWDNKTLEICNCVEPYCSSIHSPAVTVATSGNICLHLLIKIRHILLFHKRGWNTPLKPVVIEPVVHRVNWVSWHRLTWKFVMVWCLL